MTERQSELRAALKAALQPVLDQLALLEEEIAERETELRSLKDLRTKTRAIAHSLDPKLPPGRGQRSAKGGRGPGRAMAAAETVERIREWLVANIGSNEYSAPGLMEDGFDLTSYATLTAALSQLHGEGAIRLDHQEKGGRKVYRLT